MQQRGAEHRKAHEAHHPRREAAKVPRERLARGGEDLPDGQGGAALGRALQERGDVQLRRGLLQGRKVHLAEQPLRLLAQEPGKAALLLRPGRGEREQEQAQEQRRGRGNPSCAHGSPLLSP